MEIEARFFYALEEKDKILNRVKSIDGLLFDNRYYEKTDQYNHPMKKYDFYSKEIDGRFRVRITKNDNYSKCMVTWKRRLKKLVNNIHQEEEVELDIKADEYDNLVFLLTNVLHLELVESYERYRNRFYNDDVEVVVDEYPFGIALEVENKNKDKDGLEVVREWVTKIGLDLDDAYTLSWDDKYLELCNKDGIKVESIVTFDKKMPNETNLFPDNIKK